MLVDDTISTIIKQSINKHLLIGSDAYPLRQINFILYVLHGLSDVTLQSTQHEVIWHSLREVTSERQVISHDPSVTLMVENGRKCITYINYIIKQLLTDDSVDMECY